MKLFSTVVAAAVVASLAIPAAFAATGTLTTGSHVAAMKSAKKPMKGMKGMKSSKKSMKGMKSMKKPMKGMKGTTKPM